MQWPSPLLTIRAASRSSRWPNRKIDDDGVTFKSHIDGSTHRFTPEKSIAIQETWARISSWLLMNAPTQRHRLQQDCHGTNTSLGGTFARGKTRGDQALFGIVQGGIDPDLRTASAQFISSLPFPGIAIGGLSVGETKKEMYATLDY